ncbi:MAG: ribonuclease G [Halieaceae bacterium]|nr:ribonuclease G [Halieaceae bacterium]
MSAEILVNVTPMEVRVAVVENGAAQDIHIERETSRGIVGNIYAGRVARVMPGMQAAFVDIGVARTAFIHLADIIGTAAAAEARITEHLRDGQQITVQVVKDPIGNKGARLTAQLSVSTRHLVYMPGADHVGVSQRIEDTEERARLQQVLAASVASEEMEAGGYILRTAAEGAGEGEIRADLRYLKRLWAVVARRMEGAGAPQLLYEDLPLQLRTVRDLARPGIERILVDSDESFAALRDFCAKYMPEVAELVEHYDGERPIFDLYGVEEDMQRALSRVVPLKSGGHLVFDQTEAMTTIDVNTGSFVGKRSQEDTLFKTNLEAPTALARQLRLRNLGGIIIVDFIDMSDAEHRRQVHRALEKAMARDPARNKITGVSDLGLVEMTRKRTRESLERMLCETCPVCEGRGVLKTPETVCYEIFREILRDARAFETGDLMVLASPTVVERLLEEESASAGELESYIGRTIGFRAEPDYGQEQFDIVLL